eukprot:1980701-Alexandrium_andersonii.AAC.1
MNAHAATLRPVGEKTSEPTSRQNWPSPTSGSHRARDDKGKTSFQERWRELQKAEGIQQLVEVNNTMPVA